MAETDFARLDHRVPIARAEVRSGPTDLDALTRATADDGHAYEPLHGPGSHAHGWSPPEPEQPTEATLRVRLADALATEHEAHVAAGDAIAARERAERHLERCQCSMRTFTGLDEAIAAETVAQLSDGDCARVAISDDLSARLAERDHAKVSLAAAERALETLTQEQVTVCDAAAEARRRANTLIANILAFRADEIAARHVALLQQAAELVETLHALNQCFPNANMRLSPAVRAVLGHDMSQLARRRDRTVWLEAADALRQNPSAELEIS